MIVEAFIAREVERLVREGLAPGAAAAMVAARLAPLARLPGRRPWPAAECLAVWRARCPFFAARRAGFVRPRAVGVFRSGARRERRIGAKL